MSDTPKRTGPVVANLAGRVKTIEERPASVGERGESAYEVAKRNGYTGTESQWIESLRGASGRDGSPKRVEQHTGTVAGGQGVATIAFPVAFASPPLCTVVDGWSGAQMITGEVTATTTTTATVVVRRSRGTLALSAGPFETAPNGTTVKIQAIGD